MTLLQSKQGKYPGFYDDWSQKEDGTWITARKDMVEGDGWMLPDDVLDSLHETLKVKITDIAQKGSALEKAGKTPTLAGDHRARFLIPDPKVTWDQTAALVIDAFRRFDPELGERVAAIFSDPSRIILHETEPGQALGYCTPPSGIFKPRHERATIVYHRDGTINDPIYMMHEIGHMLSNDLAQERGYDIDDVAPPKNVSEIPAMVSQLIIYDYLMHGQPDSSLKNAAQSHFVGHTKFSFLALHENFSKPPGSNFLHLHMHSSAAVIAEGLYSSGAMKDPRVFDGVFCRGKDSSALKILAASGVATKESLDVFFTRAFESQEKTFSSILAETKPKAAVTRRWQNNSLS